MLVADSHSYNLERFERAAALAGAEVVAATDRCHVLAGTFAEALGDRVLALNLRDEGEALQQILGYARERPLNAILSLSDKTTEIAARAAEALGLPHNAPAAARAARSKIAMREALARAGVPQPPFRVFAASAPPRKIAAQVSYPCVVKPALLSASRGVIRADDPRSFVAAFERVGAILAEPEITQSADPDARRILVEGYVPGVEVAVEAWQSPGGLELLALFDKPDPLTGPFFEETLYVTPSRLPPAQQERIVSQAGAAASAIGLCQGPIHAELRAEGDEVWVIEVAARPIGGLCGSALRFDALMSLEELVVRRSLGLPSGPAVREAVASGVMMLPIPRAGVFWGVSGREEALAVPLIEGLTVTLRDGDEVVPLPEGKSYLGFLFARGREPGEVEAALRRAHRLLRFDIRPRLHEQK
jgi:formate-dependent phosphoribosylglycinamide formyltransferase (GAR transformylase)